MNLIPRVKLSFDEKPWAPGYWQAVVRVRWFWWEWETVRYGCPKEGWRSPDGSLRVGDL